MINPRAQLFRRRMRCAAFALASSVFASSVLADTRLPRTLGTSTGTKENTPPGDDSGKQKPKEAAPPKEDPSKCVTHKEQARYINGYDHLVHVKNGCSKPVSCNVSTDVNPKEQKVSVAPGRTETVLTFRGSPASTFVATVVCGFETDAG